MRVLVNGVRLFFDVEGANLVPDGPSMREKPTLLLLHGGPGFDHSICKPAYSSLADYAQIIYLDHRGNGRSDTGPKEASTLAQWGDDVRPFCEVLGIADRLGSLIWRQGRHGLYDASPSSPCQADPHHHGSDGRHT
jgi:pimeloyl-ACP methyl ester carboxylesterase